MNTEENTKQYSPSGNICMLRDYIIIKNTFAIKIEKYSINNKIMIIIVKGKNNSE